MKIDKWNSRSFIMSPTLDYCSLYKGRTVEELDLLVSAKLQAVCKRVAVTEAGGGLQRAVCWALGPCRSVFTAAPQEAPSSLWVLEPWLHS